MITDSGVPRKQGGRSHQSERSGHNQLQNRFSKAKVGQSRVPKLKKQSFAQVVRPKASKGAVATSAYMQEKGLHALTRTERAARFAFAHSAPTAFSR